MTAQAARDALKGGDLEKLKFAKGALANVHIATSPDALDDEIPF